MNTVRCPRCGHDHGNRWGDDPVRSGCNTPLIDPATVGRDAEGRTIRPIPLCECHLPLSTALVVGNLQQIRLSLGEINARVQQAKMGTE